MSRLTNWLIRTVVFLVNVFILVLFGLGGGYENINSIFLASGIGGMIYLAIFIIWVLVFRLFTYALLGFGSIKNPNPTFFIFGLGIFALMHLISLTRHVLYVNALTISAVVILIVLDISMLIYYWVISDKHIVLE